MCDPLTLLAGIGAITGAKKQTPPPESAPAAPVEDAKAETGADVILGGELDSATATKKKKTTGSGDKQGGSGLRTGNKTGLSIL